MKILSKLLRIHLVAGCLISTSHAATSFGGVTTLLGLDTSDTTPALDDVTNLSVTSASLQGGAGYTGNAFVFSSYSTIKTNNSDALYAHYGLNQSVGGAIGQTHTRHIAKDGTAAGAGSAVGIVNITASSSTVLQHGYTTIKSNVITTLAGSTLTVIPLTAGGDTLNHATATVGATGITTAANSVVATTNALTVSAVHAGTKELFMAASFDVSNSVAATGTWQFQYRLGAGAWTDAGNAATRDINEDSGIVTLVALADLSGAGDYEVRLTHSTTGGTLTTSDVDIVAVSLSIDANRYLQTFEGSDFSSTGSTMTVNLPQTMDVFSIANITVNTASTNILTYSMNESDDGGAPSTIASLQRESPGTFGSAALASITNFTAGGVDTISLTVNNADGFATNSNFIAFGLTAIPEPCTALLGCLGLLLILRRRR